MQCSHAVANTVDPRSDSFDVLHYHIKASFSNFAVSKSITGEARLLLVLKQPATKVRLDLLGLLVNAVKLNGTGATFQYLSPSLRVDIGNGQQGDTIELIISSSGQPKQDALWTATASQALNPDLMYV
jgi:aminopeptidase N